MIDNGTTYHSWLIMSLNFKGLLVARNTMLVMMVKATMILRATTNVNVVTVVAT